MQNQASTFIPKKVLGQPWAGNLIFYGFILFVIVATPIPSLPDQVFILKKFFDSGQENVFRLLDPGAPFSMFEPYIHQNQRISFLMDLPYSPYDMSVEHFQAAQRYFTPRILTPFPTQEIALFHCSANPIAEKRAQETGYKITHMIGNGKAVGKKIS